MAINPTNALPLRHTVYVAASGGGKTVAVKRLNFVPPRGCVALFDPYGDYRAGAGSLAGLGGRVVHHYESWSDYAAAFGAAWKSGKPFALAYSPRKGADRGELLKWCALMWAAADGRRRLDLVIEELAKTTETAGKETGVLGEIATGGRKFGLVLHTVFQRPAEVPKTIWANAPYRVIGAQEAMADARRLADEIDAPLQEIIDLGRLNKASEVEPGRPRRLHYLIKSPGLGNWRRDVVRVA